MDITGDKAAITSHKISFHLRELWIYPRKRINILLSWLTFVSVQKVVSRTNKGNGVINDIYIMNDALSVSYKFTDEELISFLTKDLQNMK